MRKTGMLQCEGGWIWEHHIPLGTDGDESQPGTVDGRVGSWSEIPFQFANTTPSYYDPLFGESSISQRAGYVSTTGSSEHPLSNAPRSYEVANIVTDPEDLEITAAETFHSSPQLIPSALRNTTTASSSPTITPSSSGRSEPSVQTLARRLYRCHICSATFPAKSNCTRHEKTVHGRTIPCDHCGKPVKVGRADYRELHRRTCKAQSG